MITVIIPAYNRSALIARSVHSVLEQDEPDLEVLVVDDGSDDGTPDTVRALGDPRVRCIVQPRNMGACAARNRGIREARGEYIAFQDSDDEWLPGKLACQMRRMRESEADVVVCAFERRTAAGKADPIPLPPYARTGRVTYPHLLYENFISTQTVLGKSECFRDVQFDESMPRLQDWEIMLRMTQKYKVWYYEDVLVRQHLQKSSISGDPRKGVTAMQRIMRKYGPDIRRDPETLMHHLLLQQSFRRSCGMNCAGLYAAQLSPVLPLHTNLKLLRETMAMVKYDIKYKLDK